MRSNLPSQTTRRDATIGIVAAAIGVLILNLLFGLVAIYFGLRARRGGSTLGTVALGLGIFDVVLGIFGLASWHTNALST